MNIKPKSFGPKIRLIVKIAKPVMETSNNDERLVGLVGLPGSGKTSFLKIKYADFVPYDDIGGEDKWWQIAEALKGNKPVIFTDIEFCKMSTREDFEKNTHLRVRWVFFENNPFQCALNCMHRWIDKRDRNVIEELMKIERLSKVYQPVGDVQPVFKTSCNCPCTG